MSISSANIQYAVAQQVGNIMRNEGVDSAKPNVECTPKAQRHLGKLIVRMLEKCTPYTERNTEDGFSIINVMSSALESRERLLEKSLSLASRLYETSQHIQIPSSTFLTLSFEGRNDDGEPLKGIALLTFAAASGSLAYGFDENGRSMDYVEAINESSLERVAIWHEEAKKVWVLEKKTPAVKYWIEQFLHLKPVLTENKATAAASQLIKKISEKIDSVQESNEYKQRMKEMLDRSSSVSFEEIEACSKEYIDDDTFSDIRERIEKQTSLSLQGEYELPAQTLHKKVEQFTKTMRLTPKLDVTIKGKQEVISMEQLSSDESSTILLKLKLKEEE